MRIDLNCDLGESFGIYKLGHDEEMMDYVSSINVACGMHAGDPDVMLRTVRMAIEKEVSIGAHPGFPDLKGFGRRDMDLSPSELESTILYQVGALKTMVEAEGGKLQHVKPHGALYNLAARDYVVASVIVKTIKKIDKDLVIMGLAGSEMEKACEKQNMVISREMFADRRYTEELALQSRKIEGSVLSLEEAIEQCRSMVADQGVVDCSGTFRTLDGDTICVHGDNVKGVELVKALRGTFKDMGIEVMAK